MYGQKKLKIGATEIIIGINIILFIPFLLTSIGINLPFNIVFGLGSLQIDPSLFTKDMLNFSSNSSFSITAFNGGAFWQILTACFLHGGFWHILFNMFILFQLGKLMEIRWGAVPFTIFYLTVGILANLLTAIIYIIIKEPLVLIGASGAIYGVLLAFTNYYPDAQFRLFFFIPFKAKWLILVFVAVNVLLGVFSRQRALEESWLGRIAFLTHLSGFLFAYFYMLIFYKQNAIKNMFFPPKRDDIFYN